MVRRGCWLTATVWAPALFLGCSDGSSGGVAVAPPPASCQDYRPPAPTSFPATKPDLLIPLSSGSGAAGDGKGGLWLLNVEGAGTERGLAHFDAQGARTDQPIAGLPERVQLARGDTEAPWAYFAIERPTTIGGRLLAPPEAQAAVMGLGPAGVTVPPIALRCAGAAGGCYPRIVSATHFNGGVALLVHFRDGFEMGGTSITATTDSNSALVVLDGAGVVKARTVGTGLDTEQVVAQDDGRLTVWGTSGTAVARTIVVESYPAALEPFTRHQVDVAPGLAQIHAAPGPGGALYFAGDFAGTLAYGNQRITASQSSRDIAVLGIRAATGALVGITSFGGPSDDAVLDLASGGTDRLWLAGTAVRRLTVEGAELDLGTAYPGRRAFVARLDGAKLGAAAVVSQAGSDAQPDTLPYAIFPSVDDRFWMLATSTLPRSGGQSSSASPWYQLSRVTVGQIWGSPSAAGTPLSDPAARRLTGDELSLAHPDELHAAGGVLVAGGEEPLAAAVLARADGRWHTTATIPGPAPSCAVTSQLATDGNVVVRTTAPGRFCDDKDTGLGFEVHERATDGQFLPVTLPRTPHESEWFSEGAAVHDGVLALGAVPFGFSDNHRIELFHRGAGGWTAGQVVEPPSQCPNIFNDCWGGFGRRMLLDRQRLLLGADLARHTRPASGKILVYQAGRDGFTHSQTIVASDAAPEHTQEVRGGEGQVSWLEERGEGFGDTLAAAGGLVVTVPSEKDAAYVLGDGGSTLSERGQLPLGTLKVGIHAAHTLALSREFLVVANSDEDYLGSSSGGAVYVFRRDGDRWRRLRAITLTEPWTMARLGAGLAIHDDRWLLIAAPGQGPNGAVFEVDLTKLAAEARPDPWSCR